MFPDQVHNSWQRFENKIYEPSVMYVLNQINKSLFVDKLSRDLMQSEV